MIRINTLLIIILSSIHRGLNVRQRAQMQPAAHQMSKVINANLHIAVQTIPNSGQIHEQDKASMCPNLSSPGDFFVYWK